MKNITHKEVLFTMKKRLLTTIISAMLIATMTVGLTGCGGETSGSTPDEAIQSTKQIETAEEFSTDEHGNTYNQDASSAANMNSSNTEKEKSESTTSDNSKSESSKSDSKKNNNKNSSNGNGSSSSKTNNITSSKKSNTSANNNTSSQSNNSYNAKNNSFSGSNQKTKSLTVAVTSVSLSKSSMNVTVGSSNSFNVTINPGNATNRNYTVNTSNGNAAVSCSGSTVTVYGKNAGSCTITVKSNNGKTAKCSVTVKAKPTQKQTYNFDADYFYSKVVAYAKSKGFKFDTSLTLDNAAWRNPNIITKWEVDNYSTDYWIRGEYEVIDGLCEYIRTLDYDDWGVYYVPSDFSINIIMHQLHEGVYYTELGRTATAQEDGGFTITIPYR